MPGSEPEDRSLRTRYASILSWARFGPGTIFILCLIALLTLGLYASAHAYLAMIACAAGLVLFGVKSMEIIHLSRVEDRELIGRTCLVIRDVGKGKTGVVRVYDRSGRLNPELWSAESEHEILAGREAEIEAMRSIVLLVKPKEAQGATKSY